MWFDPAGNTLRRITIAALLFFCGGTSMYVWCELLTPRWYDGVYRKRFGMLVPSGLLAMHD